ncbi:XAP5-domain-containing protein [Aaosphaeria arxii CBS 175.79]|uniref:XAP5-domain-containing protein n=1 Tax=Aaosphaeria arxii CBS 175.79 TaxID=1450172 RepID=A0A6A5XZR0_9PLEO|nr:XAP5-domain-containing protein [Aaosphaeria arxii CBS 175.79]KAF2018788.1 XAP5-domain-containing protein [Aaosphaeria arxii CBS 175.79]
MSNPEGSNARFTSQAATAEDLLKEQTVGLVNLSDFRKRRAEALELKEREGSTGDSGAGTPRDGASTPQPLIKKKKKRKIAAKGKLSFGDDEDDVDGGGDSAAVSTANASSRGTTPADSSAVNSESEVRIPRKKLNANANVGMKPRVMTKAALAREAEQAETARKEFIAMRKVVKATEIVIPFVFYDGTNVPGGRCRVKKGDHIWLFLDKARKVGAELGVGGDKSRRDWARVSVDDLMLVRDQVILPHHYEFYHFLFNKVVGFNGPIFSYSAEPTKASPDAAELEASEAPDFNPLDRRDKTRDKAAQIPDVDLEGHDDDPTVTKVVDRRWYERNKHIYPASVWTEYNPEQDLSKTQRKDTEGNAFFFS